MRAVRIVSGHRRGSSRPVVAETDAGLFMVKLRGAAHGTAALVAEIVVAEIAEALGLRVPSRTLVQFDPGIPSDDPDQELRARTCSTRATGSTSGSPSWTAAREIRPDEVEAAPDVLALPVLWLDALVMNPDRTPGNPNILMWRGDPWLIDHGASLPFQYRWSAVNEDAPRRDDYPLARHLFGGRGDRLTEWDERLASRLPREVLQHAVAAVPDDFLRPLLTDGAGADRSRAPAGGLRGVPLEAAQAASPVPACLTSQGGGRSFDLA